MDIILATVIIVAGRPSGRYCGHWTRVCEKWIFLFSQMISDVFITYEKKTSGTAENPFRTV